MLSLLSKLKGIKFEMILQILLERILSNHLGYTLPYSGTINISD